MRNVTARWFARPTSFHEIIRIWLTRWAQGEISRAFLRGELGAEAAADLAEAMELGQQRFGWAKDRMPRLAMGHSLGAKLQAQFLALLPSVLSDWNGAGF